MDGGKCVEDLFDDGFHDIVTGISIIYSMKKSVMGSSFAVTPFTEAVVGWEIVPDMTVHRTPMDFGLRIGRGVRFTGVGRSDYRTCMYV